MAVNFITICVSVITIYVSAVTICGNLVTIYGKIEKVKGTKETMNGMVEKVNVNIILKHGNPTTIYNYLIIQLDKYTKLTDKKDPLINNNLQAHFAGAKRQQHLQKELVHLYIISASSIIHQGKTRFVTYIRQNYVGWRSANTGQYAMPAISKGSANNFL